MWQILSKKMLKRDCVRRSKFIKIAEKDRATDRKQSAAKNLQFSITLARVGDDENGSTFAFILYGPTARDNLEIAKYG